MIHVSREVTFTYRKTSILRSAPLKVLSPRTNTDVQGMDA
jgi:hypothetical protein